MGENEAKNNGVKIFPCTMRGVFCDIFNCRKQAGWFVGKPGGPIGGHMKLCDGHKEELVVSMKEVGDPPLDQDDTAVSEEAYTPASTDVAELKCQYCGREGFNNTGALTMHERYCKDKQK